MTAEHIAALVIGAGPAGLMAAGPLAEAGHAVVVAEARPSIGRKFLMAGKSGLNLTKDEDAARFAAAFGAGWLHPMLDAFGPGEAMAFARGLGIEVFTGSSGRVFPVGMKASPMLRAWAGRLAGLGVQVRTRWRWSGWEGEVFRFETPEGERVVAPGVTVLALGGASWPRLGSDAAWVPWLAARGVPVAPFRPANMGFAVDWSAAMAPHLGQAVKGVALSAGGLRTRGEFVISGRGIEGGGVYAISAALREGAPGRVDLLPDMAANGVAARLGGARAGDSLGNRLRKALGLSSVKVALMREWGGPVPQDAGRLAVLVKALPIRHAGPRPIAEAISSAGGVMADGLTEGLELRAVPGVFVAGEMLDWEAPTGGYLLTGCMATGLWAGQAATRRLGAR
jgi:hypothetical protein